MGIVQTGNDRLAFQVEHKSGGTNMGLNSGIIAHVDEPTIPYRKGRSCSEVIINGIDVPVEIYSISFLSMTDRSRCHEERHQREKSSKHTG